MTESRRKTGELQDLDSNWARFSGETRLYGERAPRIFNERKSGENFADARSEIRKRRKPNLQTKNRSEKAEKDFKEASQRLRTRNASAGKRSARRSRKAADRNAANLDYTRKRETQLAEELNRLKGNSRFDADGISEKDRLEKSAKRRRLSAKL
jgi:hypothetical protein